MTPAIARPGIPRALVSLGALAISGSALAALLYFGAPRVPADVELRADPVVRSAPSTPTATAVGAAAVAPRDAPPATPSASPAPARVEATNAPPAPVGVVVPDLTGKRLSAAIREARALGVRVVARDSGGYRVYGSEARYYRVSRQTTEAGSTVAPGDPVVVRVRSAQSSYGEGY